MIQMPLGLTSDLNLGQNEDNLAVHDKIIDGSGDLTGEIKIEKKMKQENIAYEKQDIDSQSGIISVSRSPCANSDIARHEG